LKALKCLLHSAGEAGKTSTRVQYQIVGDIVRAAQPTTSVIKWCNV